jgi:Predicted transcriptional regulators containing the CopG/Arc/MetJ DNA-binding domain
MQQIQVRVPDELVKQIDEWVNKKRFKSRSDAIREILTLYEEREKTRNFYLMLMQREKEIDEDPDLLISLDN